jgi:hypothetical protein
VGLLNWIDAHSRDNGRALPSSRRALKNRIPFWLRVWIAVLVAAAGVSAATDTYIEAKVDIDGGLRIVTASGKVVRPKQLPKRSTLGDQAGFDQIKISPDGHIVGWVALYPFCCTSYPIPLTLVLYSSDRTRTFNGSGLPIWRWCFVADGKQIAFEQETVHGGIGVHYERRDVANGRLLEQYDPPMPQDPNLERLPDLRNAPAWVDELDHSNK